MLFGPYLVVEACSLRMSFYLLLPADVVRSTSLLIIVRGRHQFLTHSDGGLYDIEEETTASNAVYGLLKLL
jgi:hypothetical protein